MASPPDALLKSPRDRPPENPQDFFEKKIRPILVSHCYECHSSTSKKVKGKLLLDSRAGVLQGGASGAAIVLGEPYNSLLVRAVRYTDKELQMPPAGKLPDAAIADLERWIAVGAPDPRKATAVSPRSSIDLDAARQHWAFQAPTKATLPDVRTETWGRSPVDRFVSAELEENGLDPAPAADRRTLLRRVTFDLTGLPPTPREVAAFVDDTSPDAFSRVVDRLLASPHHGEKWGRHWLDVARYADSSGKDENHACEFAFRYRDYVVDEFNRDTPYDRFVTEQIAGDLLPAATDEERFRLITATGFLQLGPKALAEQDKPKLVMDIADEQLDVISRGMLGLTITCARCHDHKLEPISSRDYYGLAGIFKSTRTMGNFEFVSHWLDRPIAPKERIAEVEAHSKAAEAKKKEIEERTKAADDALVAAWRKDFTSYLLRAAKNLTELTSTEADEKQIDAATKRLAAEHELNAVLLRRFVNLLKNPPEKEDDVLLLRETLAALEAPDDALQKSTRRSDRLLAEVDQAWNDLRARDPKAENLENPAQERRRQIAYGMDGLFAVPKSPREYYSPADRRELAALEEQRDQLEASAPPPLPMAMAVEDGEVADMRMHLRGNHLNLGEEVPRGFPQLISFADAPRIGPTQSGRLELAQWIARPDHPLTSRVMVNRIWQHHLGRGLCRSTDNFGLSGEKPTNQALLDWLAVSFVERDWSIKAMHRVILLSSTYQMSSGYNAEAARADPDNRWHWRFERRRLSAEEIRDTILSVSDNLDPTIGGNLFNYKNHDPHVSFNSRGAVHYDFPRRSIYLPVVRNVLYDVFDLFDFGDALTLNPRRSETTVAPQALYMMNSPAVIDAADRLATALLETTHDDEARIRHLYEKTLARPPTPHEVGRALRALSNWAKIIAEEKESETGIKKTWRTLCHALLASNEFLHLN